jgi:hypothetical protein
MSETLIGALIGLGGVAVGVLLPLLASFIKYCYMKPRIVIQNDEPQQGGTFSFHSIRIHNNGRTVVKNCQGLLTIQNLEQSDIDPSAARVYVTNTIYRPIKDESLCWAFQIPDATGKGTNPASLSISPKSSRLLEVCHVDRQSTPWTIEVPSEMGWHTRRVVLWGNKNYDIQLKVIAENVQYDPPKHTKKFNLKVDNQKNDIVIESVKG